MLLSGASRAARSWRIRRPWRDCGRGWISRAARAFAALAAQGAIWGPGLAALLLALPGAAQGPRDQLAAVRSDVGFDVVLGTHLPTATPFRADDGRATDLAACMAGKPTILALVYYHCPMLCNEMIDALVHSLRGVDLTPGNDYSVVLVSIDPGETPERAARRRAMIRDASAGRAGGAGWALLTGDGAAIAALAGALGFRYRALPETGDFAHASGICIVSPEGTVTRAFRGIDYPARDLQLALVESSRGVIGSIVDRALLLCYAWDPASGRYGLAVATVLRVSGALTVGALLLGIVVMSRRDRRRRPRPA